jgi:hypothetical protein
MSCLIMHMAAASRPLAITTASALLDSSSSSYKDNMQALMKPLSIVVPLRRLLGEKPVNQAAIKSILAALKLLNVSAAAATGNWVRLHCYPCRMGNKMMLLHFVAVDNG